MKLSSFWEVLLIFISPPAPRGRAERSEHIRADDRFTAGGTEADADSKA